MAATTIFCVGKIVDGEIHWHISPLPVEEVATDGTLQRMIDEANADLLAEEWQDHRLEQEWLDHWL